MNLVIAFLLVSALGRDPVDESRGRRPHRLLAHDRRQADLASGRRCNRNLLFVEEVRKRQ
jgi:hypothetical protein